MRELEGHSSTRGRVYACEISVMGSITFCDGKVTSQSVSTLDDCEQSTLGRYVTAADISVSLRQQLLGEKGLGKPPRVLVG